MSKPVMKTRFLGKQHQGQWLTVDRLYGSGAEYADLSFRDCNEKGQPGKRIVVEFGVTRTEVIQAAFGLLDVADVMQPESTYAHSESVHSGLSEPRPDSLSFLELNLAERKRDVVKNHQRLRERMPTLQLAQRVLERCNDEVAATLCALLVTADQTGDLPLRAETVVRPPPEIVEAMRAAMAADSEDVKKNTH